MITAQIEPRSTRELAHALAQVVPGEKRVVNSINFSYEDR